MHGKLALGVDNTAAIDVASNLGVTARTKHFARYLRICVDELKIGLLHVRTEIQRGDLFTKCLDKTAFLRHRRTMLQ